MKASSLLLIGWAAGFCAAATASAQDLFERHRRDGSSAPVTVSEYRGRDRLDLHLSADATKLAGMQDAGSSILGVSGAIDYDFACGRFDVRSNLRQLLDKEAREDFLEDVVGALLGELAHNTLVLVCESSPTVCQALQHYRISANAMLGMQYDWCQAIESAVDDASRSTRAKAIKDCIEERRARGKTLDQAREECENPDKVRGLDGRFVSEIDLIEEVRRVFGLPQVQEDILAQLIGSLRYTPKGGQGEIRTTAALDRHRKLVEKYRGAWDRAIRAAGQRRELTEEELSALAPEKASRLAAAEVLDIAALSPGRREAVVRSIVSSVALFQLSLEVGGVVKLLDAARKHPTADQGFVRRLEKEREDLERQLAELTRLHELQERHNRTLIEAAAVAQADLVKKGTRTILSDVQKDEGRQILLRNPRWGTFPEKASSSSCCDVNRPGMRTR
jgi:hypothetical protein